MHAQMDALASTSLQQPANSAVTPSAAAAAGCDTYADRSELLHGQPAAIRSSRTAGAAAHDEDPDDTFRDDIDGGDNSTLDILDRTCRVLILCAMIAVRRRSFPDPPL